MSDLPILIATLPLPPSINKQYANDEGGRHKTEEASEFQTNMLSYLDHPQAPYTVWTDSAGLRELYEKVALMTGKSRITWLQKPRYSLDVQFVFANDRRDIDGGLKILLDTLCIWLYGLNDNRFWSITLDKMIDPTFPHVEIVLSPDTSPLQHRSLAALALERVINFEKEDEDRHTIKIEGA